MHWHHSGYSAKEIPHEVWLKTIYKWCKLFNETGCIFKGQSPGKRPVTEAKANNVGTALFFSQFAKVDKAKWPTLNHSTVESVFCYILSNLEDSDATFTAQNPVALHSAHTF